MPNHKKYYRKDDGLFYKVCIDCGEELLLSGFGKIKLKKGHITYNSKCKKCTSVYNKKYKISREKKLRITEAKLDETRAELSKWLNVAIEVSRCPLSKGFKSPQEFILATLKTVYDGRKTSEKELLQPSAG